MTNLERFDRISLNPAVMGGKPCIRGMRITVGMVLSQLFLNSSFNIFICSPSSL
jgi:uncharacterized protein (DUF433 family)